MTKKAVAGTEKSSDNDLNVDSLILNLVVRI